MILINPSINESEVLKRWHRTYDDLKITNISKRDILIKIKEVQDDELYDLDLSSYSDKISGIIHIM